MYKFAGVTFDHYDDSGAMLREVFPTINDIPEVIKEAELRPKEKLADQDFALVAADQGEVYRKYPCYDPGSTLMSMVYFEKNAHKLPEPAQKVAAHFLTVAAVEQGLLPSEQLSKTASENPESNFVDVTGHRVKPRVKEAQVQHYAFKNHYPIETPDQIKQASQYWVENNRSMDPVMRREYAVKVASRAEDLGVEIDGLVKQAGANTYGPKDQLDQAIVMRKVAFVHDPDGAKQLEKIASFAGQVSPHAYAAALGQFDQNHGLDQLWDRAIPDPFQSTYGVEKVAKIIWEDGPDRLTSEALHLLSTEYAGDFDELFSDDIVSGFDKDPIGTFNKLPKPLKRRIARLAEDLKSGGGTEAQSTYGDSEDL